MQLADQLMKAIENQLGVNGIPQLGWDSDVNTILDSIRSMEDLNKDMEKDVAFLGCLNAAGVDNWSGYSEAQEMYDDEYK